MSRSCLALLVGDYTFEWVFAPGRVDDVSNCNISKKNKKTIGKQSEINRGTMGKWLEHGLTERLEGTLLNGGRLCST
jgi:hypothetical protein